jgi:hypothetical protein
VQYVLLQAHFFAHSINFSHSSCKGRSVLQRKCLWKVVAHPRKVEVVCWQSVQVLSFHTSKRGEVVVSSSVSAAINVQPRLLGHYQHPSIDPSPASITLHLALQNGEHVEVIFVQHVRVWQCTNNLSHTICRDPFEVDDINWLEMMSFVDYDNASVHVFVDNLKSRLPLIVSDRLQASNNNKARLIW